MDIALTRLLESVSQHGYAIVFIGTLADNSGVPTFLLGAAILAGMGHLELGTIVAISLVASLTRDQLCYWVGKWNRGNSKYVESLPKHFRNIYHEAEACYSHHSMSIVIWGRFLFGIGAVMPLFAGVYRLSVRKFFAYSVSGSIIFVVSYGVLGYYCGPQIRTIFVNIKNLNLAITLAVVLLAGMYLWRKRDVRNMRTWGRS